MSSLSEAALAMPLGSSTTRFAPADDGWRAHLALRFERRATRSELVGRRHYGPLTVQRPFYPEGEPAHIYLLHPPGGVVGGDRLHLQVQLEEGSHALLTMPGATKFYRSAGPTSLLEQHFQVAAGATLEWLPQDSILFPGAKMRLHTRFQLEPGARLMAWETLCLGRPVMGETFDHGRLDSLLVVELGGEPLLHERLRLDGGSLAKVGGLPLLATFCIAPATETLLEQAREELAGLPHPVGATLLDEHLLVIRLLDDDNQRLQSTLQRLWQRLRPAVIGRAPCPPRIWAT
ncbi:urease accessory protein [Pseudomonas oryzae]|uniref:Urease accessory protein UreD n=2 Tax=Pseudomonas oryzae TaxID=1392877 RepID=A0A1H1QT75_9PSED|nr:urease accessory protein [Pseudomonas oryzae]